MWAIFGLIIWALASIGLIILSSYFFIKAYNGGIGSYIDFSWGTQTTPGVCISLGIFWLLMGSTSVIGWISVVFHVH